MKNPKNFRLEILEMKKRAFEDAVRRCSERLDLDRPPIVSITEIPCPLSSSSDEIAHIHPDERIICISKKKLESIDLDTIEWVAAHEVAHLISRMHDGKHAKAQAELKTLIWRPPPGIVVIDGSRGQSSRTSIISSTKVSSRAKNVCSYHLCAERTELRECRYCGKKFCKDHLKAKSPSLPPFNGRSGDMIAWRGPGHPCPDYLFYSRQKEKEDLQKRWDALNKMRRGGPTPVPVPSVQLPGALTPSDSFPEKPPYVENKPKRKIMRWLGIIMLVFLIAVIVAMLILLIK
jgi:hypothetical protein